MSVFGDKWENHEKKIIDGFSAVTESDVTVICGDLSWSTGAANTVEEFRFVDALPGKKILLKGNHDYWWTTMKKMQECFRTNGITTVSILHNTFYEFGDYAICGTRGWFYEEETGTGHDEKIMAREVGRLKASLEAAGERKKIVFLHFPPIYRDYKCPEILALLKEHDVRLCCYGHLHGKGCIGAVNGWASGTEFRLVSADYLNFRPLELKLY